ncbi:hypothetical protein NE237_021045 [Protea cynaroides]|uniref:S-protein homolog n=1 Tax=Protea cynaroides TaxID=273540 RepID=A0A9Q0HAK6_9MAGN|nr:hypothetical protein NE237_021045 [Protea cynaroides]
MNAMEVGKNLTCHCKSKKNDFRVMNIPFHQIYDFSFNDPFREMIIYCNMQWESSIRLKSSGTFTIYGMTRPSCIDMRVLLIQSAQSITGQLDELETIHCPWVVKENGLCYYNRYTNKWECLGWNEDGKPNTVGFPPHPRGWGDPPFYPHKEVLLSKRRFLQTASQSLSLTYLKPNI